MFFVYIVWNTITDRVYVGQSKTGEKRLKQHRYHLNKGMHCNPHLQNSWNEHGAAAFELYVLGEYETREAVWEAEQFYIRWYREIGLSYNLTDGGEGGTNPSDETREKYRQRWVNQPHPMLGKKHSEETRRKLVQSHIGLPRSAEAIANHKAAMKGRKPSPQTIAASIAAHKGKPGPWLGKHHTEEMKQAMSESRKGELNPHYGKPSSDKQKQKASETWKGVKRGPFTEEHKAKIREARAKQVIPPMKEETKQLLRDKKLERERLAREKAV